MQKLNNTRDCKDDMCLYIEALPDAKKKRYVLKQNFIFILNIHFDRVDNYTSQNASGAARSFGHV